MAIDMKKKEAFSGFLPVLLRLSLTLLAVALVAAGLLAGVNALTEDRIAENNRARFNEALSGIFGEGVSAEPLTIGEDSGVDAAHRLTLNDSLAGVAFEVTAGGFGGDIRMVVGIAPDGTVAGVRITSMSETPDLGSRAGEAWFTDSYIGKSGPLSVTKNENPGEKEITAISGATITSKAVTEGVNKALSAYDQVKGGVLNG